VASSFFSIGPRLSSSPFVRQSAVSGWIWQNEASAWVVGRYVIMPDHIHLFCAPGEPEIPLDRWVSYWKRLFSQRIRNRDFSWQSHHWDTRLRRAESYDQKWDYVMKNPERAGLIERAEEWPYQGELHVLRWYPCRAFYNGSNNPPT
jgi:putative transposase